MKTKMLFIVKIGILLTMLTGCWSKKELDELAIATAIGIDKKGDSYMVTAQILNPGEIAGQTNSSRVAVSSFTTTGETLFEALRKMSMEAPRKIYLSHVRLVVFGEELAKGGIRESLDFLSRDHEMRTDFFIIVSKNIRAENFLDILTSIEKVPANKIFSSLEVSQNNWAGTKTVKLDELITCLTVQGNNPVLTGVKVIGDRNIGNDIKNVEKVDSPTKIIIDNIGVFKDDRLVGWLNEEESIGFNFIMDNVSNTIVTIPCGDEQKDKISIEVVQSKAKMTGKVEKGTPKITIEVKTDGNIGEVQCKENLVKEDANKEIEKKVNKRIKSEIEMAIKAAQEEFKSDIFGFGSTIKRSEPQAWKVMKDQWEDKFVTVETEIKVDTKIRRPGTTTESFQK